DAGLSDGVTVWCARDGSGAKAVIDGVASDATLLHRTIKSRLSIFSPGRTRDLLVITPDILGRVRIGLGMRHWEISKVLSGLGLDVTLASSHPTDPGLAGEGFDLIPHLAADEARAPAR